MAPPQDEQTGEREKEEEEHNNGAHNNILTGEIESWSKFEYALREDNRLLFNKMLSECKQENEDFIRAANSKDEFFSAESLFMVLILQQQKMINELIARLSSDKMIKTNFKYCG